MPRLNSQYDLYVHSHRKRLADIDGLSAKAVIDGCIKSGLLADDSPKHIKSITFSQSKCKKNEEEYTTLKFYKVKND